MVAANVCALFRPPIMMLPPNRVRRLYRGGGILDSLSSGSFEYASGIDANCPEDWIASVVPATNPGMPETPGEGLTEITTSDGEAVLLRDLFANDSEFFLGKAHVRRMGADLGFLLKLLDSAVPLPLQVHPTRQFARANLNASWGKFESYVILNARDEETASIRVGFQHAPSREELRRIVEDQSLEDLNACFDPLPVQVGDVWIVPGGIPHAIGAGLLLIEAMEPSDFVVRFELRPNDLAIPPETRFLGGDIEFALDMINFKQFSVEEAKHAFKVNSKLIKSDGNFTSEDLVGPSRTDAFRLRRYSLKDSAAIPTRGKVLVGIVAGGRGTVVAGGQEFPVMPGSKFLVPAGTPSFNIQAEGGEKLTLVVCVPGETRKT
jgi:mannose-6-phosphate isomerase